MRAFLAVVFFFFKAFGFGFFLFSHGMRIYDEGTMYIILVTSEGALGRGTERGRGKGEGEGE